MSVLSTLTPREEMVLKLRFGLEDGRARTLEEVGREFKVTRERIRPDRGQGPAQAAPPQPLAQTEGFHRLMLPPNAISLDARLSAIRDLAGSCACFADIGADHGRLGAHMLLRGLCGRAQLADISEASLSKARRFDLRAGADGQGGVLRRRRRAGAV